jgi:hypothetical protein
MIGWVILLVICVIGLILLSCSNSGPSSFINNVPTPPAVENNKHIPASAVVVTDTTQKADIEMAKKQKSYIKNVASSAERPLDWFVVRRAQDQISKAEKLISAELSRYKVDWYREVAFEGLKFSDYGYARYDFLIVTPKGIHLIEYDGKISHSTHEQKLKDTLKDKFCKNNGIPLTRYSSKHYYHIPYEISKLMNEYGIKKKGK